MQIIDIASNKTEKHWNATQDQTMRNKKKQKF